MLDAVENSLRDMFSNAAARACNVPTNLAHLVGEAAAESWYATCLPKNAAERALWLRGAQAVMPLIPSRPLDGTPRGPSSLRAMEGARNIVRIMIQQAHDDGHCGTELVDLSRVPPVPSSARSPAAAPRGTYRRSKEKCPPSKRSSASAAKRR